MRFAKANKISKIILLVLALSLFALFFDHVSAEDNDDLFSRNKFNSGTLQSSETDFILSDASEDSENHYFFPLIVYPGFYIPFDSLGLVSFNVNTQDVLGPADWYVNYGKKPEIVVASNGSELDVLLQDYNGSNSYNAALLHIEKGSTGYSITQALTGIPMLDRIMGLDIDNNGNRYYAVGVDEDAIITPEYPPPNTYRTDIVRVIKINQDGDVVFNIDLDIARSEYDPYAEMIINPMWFGTSRLAVTENEIGILFSTMTNSHDGVRHQKALSTRMDPITGSITRVSSVWVSHSLDQRLYSDADEIIEYHLGDAYPRYLVFNRYHQSYPLFHIKGELGENLTATRLGNISAIENDPLYKFIVLFVTETSSITGGMYTERINGPRNLAIVRVNGSDNTIDPSSIDELTVISSDVEQTNRLRWLTYYTDESSLHAERPNIIGIGNDQYIILWEEWRCASSSEAQQFIGVKAMRIDANGNVLQPSKLISSTTHLPRGDDAFILDGRAAWMTGDQNGLYIHFVDALLNYEEVRVD